MEFFISVETTKQLNWLIITDFKLYLQSKFHLPLPFLKPCGRTAYLQSMKKAEEFNGAKCEASKCMPN